MINRKQNNKISDHTSLPASIRTGEGLRDTLFDEIDSLRRGNGDRRRALAIASLAHQIISTIKVEISYQQHLALLGASAGKANPKNAVETLKLGTSQK